MGVYDLWAHPQKVNNKSQLDNAELTANMEN